MEDISWSRQLAEWAEKNPDKVELLGLSRGTFLGYCKGEVKSLDRINAGTRALLYKHTSLEVFNWPGYADPKEVSIEKMISGRQPLVYLDVWLGVRGFNRNQLASDAGVHPDSVRNWVGGLKIRDNTRTRILGTLRKYASGEKQENSGISEEIEPSERPEQPAIVRSNDLQQIAKDLSGLRGRIEQALGTYEPTEDERAKALSAAIDSLVDGANYYSENADRQQRTDVIDLLREEGQLRRLGYAMSLINTLTDDTGSSTSFARAVDPPKKGGKGR